MVERRYDFDCTYSPVGTVGPILLYISSPQFTLAALPLHASLHRLAIRLRPFFHLALLRLLLVIHLVYWALVFLDEDQVLMVVAFAHACVAGKVVGVLAVALDFALATEVVEFVGGAHGC